MAEFKQITDIDPDSMFDVMDEAIVHLLEHFRHRPNDERFKNDYCFAIGKTHMGVEKIDPAKPVATCHMFVHGDMHEFAHDLADMMKGDKELARWVMHAIEVYGWRE